MPGVDRLVRRANQKGWPRAARSKWFKVGLGIEPRFAVFVASLNLDQPHVETRVFVGCESQRPRHVDRPNRLIAGDVVHDRVSFANKHTRACAWYASPFPCRCG